LITAGTEVGAVVGTIDVTGAAVGASVGEVTGSKMIFPNADNVVLVDVSVTSIGSEPAVVEVAVNVALPVASKVAESDAKTSVESVEFAICIVSPASGFPDESLSVIIIVDCVVPSAGTSVAINDELAWSGGFPANTNAGVKKAKMIQERKKVSTMNFLGITYV
jgi:hypothetical protein